MFVCVCVVPLSLPCSRDLDYPLWDCFYLFIFILRIQILRPRRPLNRSNMNLCAVVEFTCVSLPRLVESVLEHIKVFGIDHDPWKVIPRSRPSVVKGV